jgi:hypothetical protein
MPDGDHVLALLDGRSATSEDPSRRSRASADERAVPREVRLRGRLAGRVLVNEAAQGNVNFNAPGLFSPAWAAPQCAGHADGDTNDDIVFTLRFAAWVANPLTDPPRNTGLVGSQKIAIANGFVATITPEDNAPDAAGEGTCDLNGDGDLNDRIARFAPIFRDGGHRAAQRRVGSALFVPGERTVRGARELLCHRRERGRGRARSTASR